MIFGLCHLVFVYLFMRVAIVHDYLNQYGGAERGLEEFLRLFPRAHLYTLLYDKARTLGRFDSHLFETSFLDWGLVARYHRPFIPFMPFAATSLNLGDRYHLIISTTAGFAKGVRYAPGTFHLSYCHTPLRYAWEIDTYFTNPLYRIVFRPAFTYLKQWDFRAAQRPDIMLANSDFIAQKIKGYYRREAKVVHPPVDYQKFYPDASAKEGMRPREARYFLAAGRFLRYKRFDLIIDAFARLGLPLKIVGGGAEEEKLKRRSAALGAHNISFMPFVHDGELRKLYGGAAALVFPQVEDFGLVAAEAQACGAPLIAFRGGGATEIVQEGKTGIFFESQTPEALVDAVRRFEEMRFDRKRVSEASRRFTAQNFRKGILDGIPPRILEA